MLFKNWEGTIKEGNYENVHIGRNEKGNIFIKKDGLHLEFLEVTNSLETNENISEAKIHEVDGIIYTTESGKIRIIPQNLNTEFIRGLIKKVFETEGREENQNERISVESEELELKGENGQQEKKGVKIHTMQWREDLSKLVDALNIQDAKINIVVNKGEELGRISDRNDNGENVKKYFKKGDEGIFIETTDLGKEIGRFMINPKGELIEVTSHNKTNKNSTGDGR